jgi:hypothetical protein
MHPDVSREILTHSCVSQVPRLRAEAHFGAQAWPLPVGLHLTDLFFPWIKKLRTQKINQYHSHFILLKGQGGVGA